jgi:hypothetical protein
VLSVLSEQLQAKMVLGELVDARTITNLAVQLRRIFADLRQRTGQRDPSPPSLHEQLAAYGTTLDADDEEEIRVYRLAMVDRAGIDRGPLISLMWAGYFFAMWALIWRFYPGYAVLPAVLFAGLGLTGYRIDKQRKKGDVRGFTMIERTLIIISLVACVTLYGCLTRGSQTG